MCKRKGVIPAESLAAVFPAIPRDWHVERNGDERPTEFRPASSRRVWWKCAEDPRREWEASISQRTRISTGCPVRARKRVGAETSLLAKFPWVALLWHPTRDGDQLASDVAAGSHRRLWWQCGRHPAHESQAPVRLARVRP